MRLLLILLLVTFAGAAQAQQMYRWTDKNGKVQYGETPPPGVAAKAVVNRTGVAVTGPASSQAPASGNRNSARASSKMESGLSNLPPEELEAREAAIEKQRAADRARR